MNVPSDPPPARARDHRHPARWIALGVGGLVVGLSIVLARTIGTDPTAAAHTSRLVGRPAPAFDLPTLGGPRVTNTSLGGKAVIINFWNTWCIPCRAELPALKAFYDRHAEDPDFAMVGIVRDDTRDAVRTYVKEEAMKWTIAFDPGATAALDFGTRGQPETFAVTPDGQIVGFQFGSASVKTLEAFLARARNPTP